MIARGLVPVPLLSVSPSHVSAASSFLTVVLFRAVLFLSNRGTSFETSYHSQAEDSRSLLYAEFSSKSLSKSTHSLSDYPIFETLHPLRLREYITSRVQRKNTGVFTEIQSPDIAVQYALFILCSGAGHPRHRPSFRWSFPSCAPPSQEDH